MKYSAIQTEYTNIQNADPSQVNLKHMLDQQTYFVWGKSIAKSDSFSKLPMAIAAYSSRFKSNERVDTMFFNGAGTHYGLNLPEGNYTLLIYADINNDRVFQQSEVVGSKALALSTSAFPDKIVKHVDIHIGGASNTTWADTIVKPDYVQNLQSLYYPAGTIRSLDDPMFDQEISTMGMYDPASFLEHAQTMFYTLDENVSHKIPVVFVHGIGGSSRSFETIIDSMDSERYQAWFFYYPSGGDLDQLAGFFYDIFLSGNVIPMGDMPMIVVAHSMGGLVVREAINKYQDEATENKVELFVSIASPLGGLASAASGEEHGLIVLPSWRDLNPSNQFIRQLYRKPLPSFLNHQLYYAYNNSNTLKLGENSDGVVPLSSQLHPQAQRQSNNQFGFKSSHVDILKNRHMITELLNGMAGVNNIFPDSHMKILADGGLELPLTEGYDPRVRHLISYAGKYLVLLVNGLIAPIDPLQEKFIQAIKQQIPATTDREKQFIRFMSDNPDLVKGILEDHATN